MRCPNCGSHVDEGALTCPHCHFDLSLTQRIPVAAATWCPHCGALVTSHMESCPKCGLPLPSAASAPKPVRAIRPVRDLHLPEIDSEPSVSSSETNSAVPDFLESYESSSQVNPEASDQNAEKFVDPDSTSSFALTHRRPAPRFESAIPSEPSKDNLPEVEGIPRTRNILLSALLVTSLIVGAIFLITHPWDSQASDNRAKVDTPQSTEPTTPPVSKLTGQDSGSSTQNTNSDVTFEALDADYKKLGEIADNLDKNEKLFDQKAISGTSQERNDAHQEAIQNALDVSNVIEDLSKLDDSNDAYRKYIEHLTKLGNWLRNRSDALQEAWDRSASSSNPEQDKEHILAPIDSIKDSSGTSSYEKLFKENYDNWKPQKQ